MRPLTVDLERSDARPYFFWDEDVSIQELRDRLAGAEDGERLRLLAKMLREARDTDVWEFVAPQDVAEALPKIASRLGRRRAFWEFLIAGWRDDGILKPQIHPQKWERDGIRIDPPDEILANKLTTLVSRSEARDIVDVMMLERAGYSVEAALPAALKKDAGCTPATLAWVLSQTEIHETAKLPAGVSPDELRTFIQQLVQRLRRAAAPQGSRSPETS